MSSRKSVLAMIKTKTKNGTVRKAPPHGGNGKPMPIPVLYLWRILLPDWEPEYAVSLGKKQKGYPSNYKLDLGNPDLKIGIEVDGANHAGKHKILDVKKTDKLALLGWKVLRFSNKEILNWIHTGMKKDGYIVTTLKQNGISLSR
jgi:hypothetical protein